MLKRPGGSRLLAIGAGLAALTLCATACGSGGTTVQGAKLVAKGALTTCTHMSYPPFESELGNKAVGFDIDMIDLVAKKLGVIQKLVDTPFETIKTGSALNAGKCDVAAAGVTITAARAKFIDYSQPYFNATQALLVEKGLGVTSLDDIKAKKLKLGSQAATTGEDYVHGKGIDSTSFKDFVSEINGLRSGTVSAIVADYPVLAHWLKDPANSQFTIAASLNTGEHLGYVVRKGYNPMLLAVINQVIADARKDGTYKRIYEKWLGPMPAGA